MRPYDLSDPISRRIGLQRLLVLCGTLPIAEHALAGAQREEPLIDSVRQIPLRVRRDRRQNGPVELEIGDKNQQQPGRLPHLDRSQPVSLECLTVHR